MGEEKRNKIVAAITVNAILLIFIILAVLIAQIVQISVLKRRRDQLKSELRALVAKYETTEDILEDLEVRGEIYQNILKWQQQGLYTRAEIFAMLGVPDPELTPDADPVLAIVVG
ncbi:MAG: hypothetical protein NC033_04755 [Clostridiales bacterium]|nr:hypothetical protein [Clostridiales bacterium]